jgi:hypothetical protein
MTAPVHRHPAVPDPHERAALNAALHATGADTGFRNDNGRPAPWPDDIHEWRPATGEPISLEPGEQPF